MFIKKITLTDAGISKLKNFAEIAKNRLGDLLIELEDQIKDNIASYAPDEKAELYQISLPGTTYDIFKDNFLSLREAIKAEVVPIDNTDNRIFALYGNSEKMSPSIGFAWFKGTQGNAKKRSTTDSEAGEAWKTLLDKWEYGGTFTVISRDGGLLTIAMNGKNPVRVESAIKTIPAHSMYGSGGKDSTKLLRNNAVSALKKAARESGFKTN